MDIVHWRQKMPVTPYDLMFTQEQQTSMKILEAKIEGFLIETFKPGVDWGREMAPTAPWNWPGKPFYPGKGFEAWEDKTLREEVLRRFEAAGWSSCRGVKEINFKPAFMNQRY